MAASTDSRSISSGPIRQKLAMHSQKDLESMKTFFPPLKAAITTRHLGSSAIEGFGYTILALIYMPIQWTVDRLILLQFG